MRATAIISVQKTRKLMLLRGFYRDTYTRKRIFPVGPDFNESQLTASLVPPTVSPVMAFVAIITHGCLLAGTSLAKQEADR